MNRFANKFPPEYLANCRNALNTALRRVAAYRDWNRQYPGPTFQVDEQYAALPILTKADIRQHTFDGLIPTGKNRMKGFKKGHIELVKTSGTTDDQVTLIWNQSWWDASEKASWKLNSHASLVATGRHREAIMTSPICTGVISRSGQLISMKKRRIGRFLYLNEIVNPADWTVEQLDRMVDELALFRPVVLEANPTLLARLAAHINRTGRKVFDPKLIILTYEFPSRVHMRQIMKAFKSPVASSYGSTESGYVFMECEAGNFHQNADFCRVDIQPFKKKYHGRRNIGRLLVTTFQNKWFSIVRFNVGDVVRFLEPGSCPCGRKLGYTAVMEGRARDITFGMKGNAVTVKQLDEAVATLDWVIEYQLEQETSSRYLLRVVSSSPAGRAMERQAEQVLRGLYGKGAKVRVKFEKIILPEISGKHRLAKTSFPVDIDSLFKCCKS